MLKRVARPDWGTAVDLERFCLTLPEQYHDWGRPGCRPRDGRFAGLLARVRGMTAPCVGQLLAHAVSCLEPGEVYCEVGCFRGATLACALAGHPHARAEAVDNFSEFDADGANRDALRANLRALGLDGRVDFFEQDFEHFLLARRRRGGPPVGAYLYDGAHDYRSQLMGLLLARECLSDRAVVVVDDANSLAVRQATWDFAAACSAARVVLEVRTAGNGSPDWWNGVQVLAWERGTDNGHSAADLASRREPSVLRALAGLSGVG